MNLYSMPAPILLILSGCSWTNQDEEAALARLNASNGNDLATVRAPESTLEFGERCSSDLDCVSSICVTADRSFCSSLCDDSGFSACPPKSDCLEGTERSGETVGYCVPQWSAYGERCAQDDDCFSEVCVEIANGSICSSTCNAVSDCTENSDCLPGEDRQGEALWGYCVPIDMMNL